MTTLVEEYVADIQLDLFWFAAPWLMVRSGDFRRSPSLGVDRARSVTTRLPVLHGEPVRIATQNNVAHVLSGSWLCETGGTGVDGVEDPMAISDFTRHDTAISVSLSSAESTSLLALLRARRSFHWADRNFRMSMCWISVDGGVVVSGVSCPRKRIPRTCPFCRRPTGLRR